ncbi:partial phage integrase [Synechococcus sp. WH 7805]|nr:partial phage integrase [Synechococcus sp. WH 7805]
MEGVKKGGSKRFVGRYRFPPGRDGKQKELALGTYGKGARNLTLKQAKDLWEKERVWMLENPGEDPNDRKKKERLVLRLREEGCSYRSIREQTGLALSTIRRIIAEQEAVSC